MNTKTLITIPSILLLTACASNMPNSAQSDASKKLLGAMIGGVTGAVIGGQLDNDGNRDKGRILGALTGAAAGAGIGNMMDKQEAALKEKLRQETSQNLINIERLSESTLKLTLNDTATFDFDSATVKSNFYNSLNKVAAVLQQYNNSQIKTVGHTDSVGDAGYNQSLSEKRARAVNNHLINRGISSNRLQAVGVGESQPKASNNTESGRRINRRVELLIKM
jgi:outer membrane protein OmpA-like peptidoglycan-associated protein